MLRVAAGQAAAVRGDVTANVATAVRLVREAAARGARVLVLPEAFLTGYDEAVFVAPPWAESDLPGPLLAPLRRATVETGVVLVVSTPLRRADRTTMTMLVVREDTIVAAYDKQHVDADEAPYFTPGTAGESITVDGVDLALSICSDSNVPQFDRPRTGRGSEAAL